MTSAATATAPATKGFSLIPAEKLMSLYTTMLGCREAAAGIEGAAQSVRGSGKPALMSQWAAIVGAAIDLQSGDTLVSPWAGGFWGFLDSAVSLVQGNAASINTAAPGGVVAPMPLSMVFFEDRDAGRPSRVNAFRVAASRKLGIIFVKLNSTESSGAVSPATSGSSEADGYYLPVVSVDGNDVVAVYRVASEAFTHARKGHGPSVIECLRMNQTDPLEAMRNYLISKGLSPDTES